MPTPTGHTHAVCGASAFESTHWTVVLEAARQDSPSGQRALATLYQSYRYPIYAFIRRSGHSPDEAADLTQDFFVRDENGKYQPVTPDREGIYRSAVLSGFWLNIHWLWQQPMPTLMDVLKAWGML